ncbi:MAG: peptidoglycan-binding protein [Rhodobiaceae bacterium]|nr:peptidoglycan-binding protein [Rhodobiaceae bacterium]MCC0018163.1 peptidoglycan-binding protein [Rhodobiaceae bacterium]MCC0051271.1 peptidoglycan-binding protein [Rhodobiaceae bacterium]
MTIISRCRFSGPVSGHGAPARRWGAGSGLLTGLLLGCLLVLASAFQAAPTHAQDGIMSRGDLVVTGFSGKVEPPAGVPLPPGVNALDETFIDINGAALKIFDVSNPGGPPQAQLINAPVKFQAFANDIGQVFGLAIDDAQFPNVYATATSAHGLQIVIPDVDGDGRPERIRLGQPGAQWMNGQFGVVRGGGPGTVWKIDGQTGNITKFADIASAGQPNSGPGLGNIAYDPDHKQLFVSDLDTGLIHRLDMNGADLGTFDHGIQGRPANGLPPAADDGARLDITNPAFDAEYPDSWGFTGSERRVWGLAYESGRLYYAVAEGPQVWSLGIAPDGSFSGDPRWELDLPADPKSYPVSDIAFQSPGLMILAQRGDITSQYSYAQYHQPRQNKVLRYRLESPDDPATPSRWVEVPEEYAIGFPATYRNTSGGIAVGFGYRQKADGSYGFGACRGSLWTTGDALRDNPVHAARLSGGGEFIVHGLQNNRLDLVRPGNEPPWEAYFVDYDSRFGDPQAAGWVGDVEIPPLCKPDLAVLKRTTLPRCEGEGRCNFTIEVENVSNVPYEGPVALHDVAQGGGKLVEYSPPPPAPGWQCDELMSGVFDCTHPDVTLMPGDKLTLDMVVQLPRGWTAPTYENCVSLRTPNYENDSNDVNNESCDYVPTCQPGDQYCQPDLRLRKWGRGTRCDNFGNCDYTVRITNVGAQDYTGPLAVHDYTLQPGATLVSWSPQPAWQCAPGGPDSWNCAHPAPVTLSPGEFRDLRMRINQPVAGWGRLQNCARIDWQGSWGDFNPSNDQDCGNLPICQPGDPACGPNLEITKKGLPRCDRGPADYYCSFEIEVRNVGAEDYFGPLNVNDTFIPNATLASHGPMPQWNCVDGGGGNVACNTLPQWLPAGAAENLYLAFTLPVAPPLPQPWQQNCARVQWTDNGVPHDGESCYWVSVCDPAVEVCPRDMSAEKYPSFGIGVGPTCYRGFRCTFEVIIGNLHHMPYIGPVSFTERPEFPLPIAEISPPYSCAAAGGGNYACSSPGAVFLGAGGWDFIPVGFDVPFDYPENTLRNCVTLTVGPPDNNFAGNDEMCAQVNLLDPPFFPVNLGPISNTTCELGASCNLPARIQNSGDLTFTGAAGVRGQLSPELQITAVNSQTPGMTCTKTGNASYECQGDNLTIKGGGAAEYEVIVSVPADYPHSQVSHIKNMIWPKLEDRDEYPENDAHTSIITIAQPKEQKPEPQPEPTPPPPPAAEPDLAVVKTANTTSCIGGYACSFRFTVTNVSAVPYNGPLTVTDTISPAATFSSASPWSCSASGGTVVCSNPGVSIPPGGSQTVTVNFTAPRRGSGTMQNCVALTWGVPPGSVVLNVQQALLAQGYNPGYPDGKMGPNTMNAIRSYQSAHGLAVTGQVDSALTASLFGSGQGDANPANDRSCVSVGLQQPATPQPQPQPQPEPLTCPSSYTLYMNKNDIPRGYEVIRKKTGGTVYYCARPRYEPVQPLTCPPGYQPFPDKNKIPRGWEIKRLQEGNQVLFCAKPPAAACRKGWIQVNNPLAVPGLVSQGYKIEVKNNLICALAPQPCTGGRVRNTRGQCVCPADKPEWNGKSCQPKYTVTPSPNTQHQGGSEMSTPQTQQPSRVPQLQINPNLLRLIPRQVQ